MATNTNWLKCKTGPVVLTEGTNDCHVIVALCQAHSVPHEFGFYSCDSDNQAIQRFRLLLNGSDCPEKLAIVLDADAPNLASRWNCLSKILTSKGYQVPETPTPEGTILTDDNLPRVGVWLMPDNTVDGMLEDFCMKLAAEASFGEVQTFLDSAKQSGLANYKDVHNSKALIHCYLATQDEPGSPLGLAITKKVLSPDQPSAHIFTNWLKSVFC
ncbi:DUF3226 domain-containing protein [Photobacterium damselae]|uniref:DUF4435 domain-containing protein n=1 Tax=Photobacterium damselae subsp. damselae CIP 102761 TaxID=675817 RepID=D0Z5F0_PHODD|nr:DUF3226 domain-containing protein [Photobacterium damselae]EEZ39072.1 hypothetical protein VDA_000057 [Photobacterium damselae subsp. damselae CIP 102761]